MGSSSLQLDLAAPVNRLESLPQGVRRYLALDAYRGAIMVALVSAGFGFPALAGHPTWGWLARQFDHVAWEGAVFWDLIQPAFMFIVGAAMPFAFALRRYRGEGEEQIRKHVAVRALKLVLWSQVLMSVSKGYLHFQLINVLSQIAFTYFLAYWILRTPFRWQLVIAGLLLALHTGLYYAFPGPEGAFSKVGNIGQVIDKAILGYTYPGYYVTINFIPSTVTTLFGAWTALLLIREWSNRRKMLVLAGWAFGCFAAAWALAPVVPIVKRLWTASFTFYSGAYVLLLMLLFFWLVEVKGYKRWTFPLVVVGLNPIFIYSVDILLRDWLDQAVGVFTFRYAWVGTLAPVAQSCTVLAVMWYLCYWLYKRGIFLKL